MQKGFDRSLLSGGSHLLAHGSVSLARTVAWDIVASTLPDAQRCTVPEQSTPHSITCLHGNLGRSSFNIHPPVMSRRGDKGGGGGGSPRIANQWIIRGPHAIHAPDPLAWRIRWRLCLTGVTSVCYYKIHPVNLSAITEISLAWSGPTGDHLLSVSTLCMLSWSYISDSKISSHAIHQMKRLAYDSGRSWSTPIWILVRAEWPSERKLPDSPY